MLDAVSDFLRFLDLCLQLGEVRCIILLRRWLQKSYTPAKRCFYVNKRKPRQNEGF